MNRVLINEFSKFRVFVLFFDDVIKGKAVFYYPGKSRKCDLSIFGEGLKAIHTSGINEKSALEQASAKNVTDFITAIEEITGYDCQEL